MAKFKAGEEVLLKSNCYPQLNGKYIVHEARRHGDYCQAPDGMCGIGVDSVGYHLGFNIPGDDYTLWDETVIHDVDGFSREEIRIQ